MEFRIRDFNNVFRERLQQRLSGVGPDQDPDDRRAWLAEILPPPPTPLVRQTNRHHLLPAAKLEQFWAGNGEQREELMAEYDAAEAAAARTQAMRDAAAAEFRRLRAVGFTGSVVDTMERVARGEGTDEDERMVAHHQEARREAEEAEEEAAEWVATWATEELPEDDEERDAGAQGPLYFEDFDEVAATFLE
jgi:hypothetical protein